MIKVSSYLSPKRLAVFSAPDKTAAISQVLRLFDHCPQILDHRAVAQEILQRENMLATGLSCGVGVPHVRSANICEPVSAMGVLTTPVEYGGIDKQPVNIIIAVGMPVDANDDYLRYLARISYVFSKADIRRAVSACATAHDLCRIISQY